MSVKTRGTTTSGRYVPSCTCRTKRCKSIKMAIVYIALGYWGLAPFLHLAWDLFHG